MCVKLRNIKNVFLIACTYVSVFLFILIAIVFSCLSICFSFFESVSRSFMFGKWQKMTMSFFHHCLLLGFFGFGFLYSVYCFLKLHISNLWCKYFVKFFDICQFKQLKFKILNILAVFNFVVFCLLCLYIQI